MGQTKRSGVFKNVFMHKNRGLTRPQRVSGVSSTYGPLPPGALTNALWRPSWASHVYSLVPVRAACQRPCRALCCVLSRVLCLLCAVVRRMAWPLWPGPVCMYAVPHIGWALVALPYGDVQNNPHIQAHTYPRIFGAIHGPAIWGCAFWG